MHKSTLYLKNEADVSDPLCVLESREPLGIGGRETDTLQPLITLSHCVDVGDVEIREPCVGIVGNVLRTFTLCGVQDRTDAMAGTSKDMTNTHSALR